MLNHLYDSYISSITKVASKPIGVAAVCVVKDGKMLLGKRRDNGKWTQPGGHLEGDEDPRVGAVRELEEETGIKAKPSELKYLKNVIVNKKSGKKIRVYAYLYNAKDSDSTTMKEDPDAEVHRWHYISKDTLFSDDVWNSMHVPPKDNCIFQALKIERPMEKKAFAEKMKDLLSRVKSAAEGLSRQGKIDPHFLGTIKLYDMHLKGSVRRNSAARDVLKKIKFK